MCQVVKNKLDTITISDLNSIVRKLDNPSDKFLVVALYYGLGSSNTINVAKIKTKDIDLEKRTILVDGKTYYINEFFLHIVKETLNQKEYTKLGNIFQTNSTYIFNTNSEYLLKSKPSTKTKDGLTQLSKNGLFQRITNIQRFIGDERITAINLKNSGIFNILIGEKKKLSLASATNLLNERGYLIRRNNLVALLKEINKNF